ncbi:MAG: aminotransferase class IV [Pirellulales bacterium]|nr:aminotransferase class IV [Pirellulales bacterium]
MEEAQAYYNGRWLPASEVAVSLSDAGFVLGATVAEQLRTFGGRLFRLDDHLARLEHSLTLIGVDPGLSRTEWKGLAEEAVVRNHRLLAPGDDLRLSLFVTPGEHPAYCLNETARPTVCLHTNPLLFAQWAKKYETGEALAVTPVEQVPPTCWPTELKCRSRMHYFLADRHAARQEPGARALLLDREGWVLEASTANVVIYRKNEGLLSPPLGKILHGISLAETFSIAAELKIECTERNFSPEEVAAADEVLLTSTPFCLLPVTRLDGRPIADGRPGPVYRRLLQEWNRRTGVDLVRQAERFAVRIN